MTQFSSLSPGITLPQAFSPTTPSSLRAYVAACLDFLTSPLVDSLLECHPNDVAVDGPKPGWATWWKWAADGQARWKLLVPNWPHERPTSETPPELRHLLDTVDRLALPRTPDPRFSSPSSNGPIRGMSPKKSHEVSQMSAFMKCLVSQSESEIKHVVDVGAGQGYLSRALSEPPLCMNVLALDFSEVQTIGAERRGSNIAKKKAKTIVKRGLQDDALDPTRDSDGSSTSPHNYFMSTTEGTVTHEMIHINPQTLNSSVTRWISAQSSPPTLPSTPIPVIWVALHACGTLTPDILRSFLACRSQSASSDSPNQLNWYPAGLAVIGCCYNLMSPRSDFPLSNTVSYQNVDEQRNLLLSYNHRSLAAQSPLQWSISDATRASAETAIRKVVYRALFSELETLAPSSRTIKIDAHNTDTPRGKIGRLHDSAYTSFQVFVSQANKKLGIEVPMPTDDRNRILQELSSCLEVLHVLRCRIGPVIESLILVDRWLYLTENMPDVNVQAVNLFDQELGSGRNVALMVPPCTVPDFDDSRSHLHS